MQPSIKLIAVDLDGTLLDSQGRLSQRNQAALQAAMDRGVQVVIATGKLRHSAVWVIERLGLRTPGVFRQGLAIHEADGSVRWQHTLEPDAAHALFTHYDQLERAYFAYAGDGTIYANRAHPYVEAIYTRYDEPEPVIAGSLLPLAGQVAFNKIVVVAQSQEQEALKAALSAHFNGLVKIVQAVDHYIEALPPGASKGAGLARLLGELGIAPAHVLAIGDGENDIEMLELAGISVAVANAMPRTRAAADHLVASNDDSGVAEAVERFVLGQPISE